MRKIIYTLCSLCIAVSLQAQEQTDGSTVKKVQQRIENISALSKLKISGYMQTQLQVGQENSALKVGDKRGAAESETWNRIGVRRGRLRVTYTEGLFTGVFQFDVNEKGVGVRDAYLGVKLPKMGRSNIVAGVINRPFGHEIEYSSSQRESPERSLLFETLFPDVRDVGGGLTLQASENSPISFLKFEAALVAGNGIKKETDSRLDFIGSLLAEKKLNNNVKGAFGISYYNGGVYQGTDKVFKIKDKSFVAEADAKNMGKYAKREYFGLEGRININSALGKTLLSGEYLWGQQPGTEGSSKSPNSSTLYVGDTYLRRFSGWYAMLVQDLGKLPVSAVLKYENYDPNTEVAGNEIGKGNTNKADISYNTLGGGLIWKITSSFRAQAYYEIVSNEKSNSLRGYESDLKDNIFTLRLQYKF
ncbi:hypothetical protein [Porphyromonas sp.]|uniref:hypothetical protein n=1 Tax=Porphyromonas sp. TaxID=1924944 RepID=UPI0026DAFF59|nr:hypothetical protein [Porphyromonas sp.]MDO4695720.1 hypothetical protein [Porphyromonas sp.]MDO4771754.1 hypothetical protein [Porphyromonas sp.]